MNKGFIHEYLGGTLKVIEVESKREITKGDKLTSFRGESVTFECISEGSKIVVSEWPGHYYPSVFGCEIVLVEDGDAADSNNGVESP